MRGKSRRAMLPIMLATGLGCAIGGIALPGTAFAQQPWSPHRPVELVVPTAPGSSMDLLARVIQDIWQKSRRVSQPVIVQVKSGGGGLSPK